MSIDFANRFNSCRKSLRSVARTARRIIAAKPLTDENHNSDNQNQNYSGTYLVVRPASNLRKRSWTLLDRIEIEAQKVADEERIKLQTITRPNHFGKGKLKVQKLEISQLTISNHFAKRSISGQQEAARRFYVCIATYGDVLELSDVVEEKNGRVKFELMPKLTTVCKDFRVSLKFYIFSIDRQISNAVDVTGRFEPCGETSITEEHLRRGFLECFCGALGNLICVTAKVTSVVAAKNNFG